jgi:hypothetical protein
MYNVGDVAVLRAVFTDTSTGAGVDPGSVTLTITPPDGSGPIQPTPSHDGVGLYSYALPLTVAGAWVHDWVGSAPGAAHKHASFIVEP